MKLKVYAFLLVVTTALLLLPVWNIIHSKEKTLDLETLYNFDALESLLSRQLYRIGISLYPENVVIGRGGWLYLVDFSRAVLTIKRRGVDEQAIAHADKFTRWVNAWDGATDAPLYTLVGPDKSTIYPEFLPDWATPAERTILDLIQEKEMGSIIVAKASILHAKSEQDTTLYYRTDTHWNALGSWIAYKNLTDAISQNEALVFLTDNEVVGLTHSKRTGGDLARFLRLKGYLEDDMIAMRFEDRLTTELELVDFETGKLLGTVKNKNLVTPKLPMLVRSSNALNAKKVLWLRDSFGDALAPLMAMTFQETLQFDYRLLDKKMMSRILDEYQPDLVLLTVVERNLTWGTFKHLPD